MCFLCFGWGQYDGDVRNVMLKPGIRKKFLIWLRKIVYINELRCNRRLSGKLIEKKAARLTIFACLLLDELF